MPPAAGARPGASVTIGLSVALVVWLASAVVIAYLFGWFGLALMPALVAVSASAVAAVAGIGLGRGVHPPEPAELIRGWAAVVAVGLVAVFTAAWPTLLPPGGASDLTHHLMLVDVLERTRHLVDGAASEAALGEMAHYTPGLHLLIVVAGSLAGVDAYRTAYPLLALTIALKAGFVYLIAHDLLDGVRGRVPLAVAAVGLVLFAPRAYSVDGFLQAGFFAQVASELFVVAGWWALARWWLAPGAAWMMLVGLMAAAVFLVWPIWIGPLMVAIAMAILMQRGLTMTRRASDVLMATLPVVAVAALHLSQHAAWLRMAGTSGAVPALVTGPTVAVLLALALLGIVACFTRQTARVTLWFLMGVILQAAALHLLARWRGAETPYMAIKMLYLAVYPVAVLAAAGLGAALGRVPGRSATSAGLAVIVVLGVGLRAATSVPVPPPIVSADLDAAGRWARANLQPACVDYVVRDAEQAYWLHLAVMGQPRSSARTADLDGYTANRAVGRWIEGTACHTRSPCASCCPAKCGAPPRSSARLERR